MAALSFAAPTQGQLNLSGDLNRNTIASAAPIKIANYAQNDQVLVDMSAVKHSDTAGLAWVMNLLKQAREQGIVCKLKGVPNTLINLAKISEVEPFLTAY